MNKASEPEEPIRRIARYRSRSLREVEMDEVLRTQLLEACIHGDARLAAEICEREGHKKDGHVEFLYHAGKHRLAQGLVEQAQALLLEAIRKEPRFAAVYRLLGEASMRLEAYEDAMRYLQTATGLDPTDFAAWARMALIHDFFGRKAEGLEAIAHAIEHYPETRNLLRKLALRITAGKI